VVGNETEYLIIL